ncbi:MAG: InlB B-repeat-containing protein [Treponema sp.]|nr:InlB B-repeat-containing protein [Treponema sp.]
MKNIFKLAFAFAFAVAAGFPFISCTASLDTVSDSENQNEEESISCFSVTFDSDGGSSVRKQIVVEGNFATEPKDPAKKDFIFDAWYNGDEVFDFDSPITSNIMLKAKWLTTFTVTFENGLGNQLETQRVGEGKCAEKPYDPVQDGYVFAGWFNGDKPFDFDSPVTENITLTAKLLSRTLKITFNRQQYNRYYVEQEPLKDYVGFKGKFEVKVWCNAINTILDASVGYGGYSKAFSGGRGSTTYTTASVEIKEGGHLSVSTSDSNIHVTSITFTVE